MSGVWRASQFLPMQARRKSRARAWERWEIERVREVKGRPELYADLARELGRSYLSVKSKLQRV